MPEAVLPVQDRPASSPRALVVDDDRVARNLVERLLVAQGFEVVALGTALGAYEVTVSHRPHVVVVDVVMPDLDLEGFVGRIKATPDLADTSILLLSGMSVRSLEAMVKRVGADGFLSKTRGPVHLQEAIANMATRIAR